MRSAVTDFSSVAQNEHGETVARVSKKVLNGSSEGSKKSSTDDDGEHLNLKVDGFVTDYSDSDVEADSVDDSEAGVRSSTEDDDARVSGGVRQRSSGAEEIDLRFMFLEAIMERARKADIDGVEEAMSGMSLAGLDAGPRAFHGLVVAYTRAGDSEGAVRIIIILYLSIQCLLLSLLLVTNLPKVYRFCVNNYLLRSKSSNARPRS